MGGREADSSVSGLNTRTSGGHVATVPERGSRTSEAKSILRRRKTKIFFFTKRCMCIDLRVGRQSGPISSKLLLGGH